MPSGHRSEGWKKFLAEHPLGPDSDNEDFWAEYLGQNPDVLHRLLADVYQATYGVDHPPSLDDLWDLISSPQFSNDSFGIAVKTALGRRSVAWLAHQAGIAQPVLHRLVHAERPIVNINDPKGSMARMEAIARVLRVHPSYFAEWRRLWIMSLLDSAFASQPALSVGVFRRYAGFERANGR